MLAPDNLLALPLQEWDFLVPAVGCSSVLATVLAHGLDEGELLDEAVSDEHPRDELVVLEILAPEFEVPVALP